MNYLLTFFKKNFKKNSAMNVTNFTKLSIQNDVSSIVKKQFK